MDAQVTGRVEELASREWSGYALLLWRRRRWIARVTGAALVAAVLLSLVIPKRYTAVCRIMPPQQQGSSALMLAALMSKAPLGGLGSLAGGLFPSHSPNALLIDLLRSGTVTGHLIDRFDLQHVYRKRYRIDTAKKLAKNTAINDDKRSGVITLQVEDADPVRARDLAQAYLDELNKLVVQTNTSAAHQERIFLERRLQDVEQSLERSQLALSEFSSRNGTVDIKEQMRAMVDAGARVEGELMVERASLDSLRQVYGDGNIRVRQTEAKIAELQRSLVKMSGSRSGEDASADISKPVDPVLELSPALRVLPRLSVPYADLYRRVKVQDTVFDLLTQQYELARVEEAKDVPVVSVIDSPGIPEKKSFPPRTVLTLTVTAVALLGACLWTVFAERWGRLDACDSRRRLWREVSASLPWKAVGGRS